MKIKNLGFRLDFGEKLSIDDIAGYIGASSPLTLDFQGRKRIIKVAIQNDYLCGSLITIKEESKIPEIDINTYQMSLHKFGKDKQLATFNFFVLSKSNLNGLYSYYHNSTSLHLFTVILKSIAEAILAPLKNAELEALGKNGIVAEAQKNAIDDRYSKSLECHHIVSQKNLVNILEEMKSIRSYQFSVVTPDLEINSKRGLQDYAKLTKTRFSLSKDHPIDLIRQAIVAFTGEASKKGLKNAKIEGKDDKGLSRIIDIIETPDWFGEIDYNAIMDDKSIFSDNLLECRMIKDLIELADQHPEYFKLKFE